MTNINIQKEVQSILKEGFLDKESRFLKQWRRYFSIYPVDGLYSPPKHSSHSRNAKSIVHPLKSSRSSKLLL